MGGLFGVASKEECAKALVQGTLPIEDLFYGTDYHSHLGTMRGGLATKNSEGFTKFIHDITNTQFRSKFEDDIKKMSGNLGIGVISDTNSQPLEIDSSLGTFTIATVGKIYNIDQLKEKALKNKTIFTETNRGIINPTELIAKLIGQQENFEDGIKYAQESIEGSCSLLLLTDKGIYAARDKLGRTPLITGKKQNSFAVTSETTAFSNIGFKIENYLGPGEIVLITPEQIEQKSESLDKMQICSFLWVYYGFPSSNYESINVETTRYKCGAALARADKKAGFNFDEIDLVAGIPDSGTAHAIGYAIESGIPFKRPLVKYTPTWPRSFMPQDQKTRDLIAKMKLLPIKELIQNQRILFCEDSIVRGTQLKDIIRMLYDDFGAKEIHLRPACPPLIYSCDFLNFSRSKSVMDLAGRKAIKELTGRKDLTQEELKIYSNPDSKEYCAMVETIKENLGLASLKYQHLDNLVEAIGLPKKDLCTHCWNSSSYF